MFGLVYVTTITISGPSNEYLLMLLFYIYMYMHIYFGLFSFNDFILFYNCFFSLLCMYVCTCTYDYVPRWVMTGSCWGLVAFYHPFRFEF